MRPLLAVHGIGNFEDVGTPGEASALIAERLMPSLVSGFAGAGLGHLQVPELRVAYYAHVLTRQGRQDAEETDIDRLDDNETALAVAWLTAAAEAFPEWRRQGNVTLMPRQVLHWVARRRSVPAEMLARVAVAFAREVSAYLSWPARRRAARQAVADTIAEARPRVLLAHSLGSVVAYEALHAYPALSVDLLVTLGSPLGLPGAVFHALEPEPVQERGAKPPGVGRWVNLADPGDLVAVPRRLGNRFPVDHDDETTIGVVQFHTLGAYLASGITAAAIAAYLDE